MGKVFTHVLHGAVLLLLLLNVGIGADKIAAHFMAGPPAPRAPASPETYNCAVFEPPPRLSDDCQWILEEGVLAAERNAIVHGRGAHLNDGACVIELVHALGAGGEKK